MHNPYAPPAGGTAPAGAPLSEEDQRLIDYETSIGPNQEYYLHRFQELERGGSKIGWHWPAFFVSSLWFLYRKMYLAGVLNILYPLIIGIVFSLLTVVMPELRGLIGLLYLALLVAPFIVLPLFATSLYWTAVVKRIDNLPRSVRDNPERRSKRLERKGGTSIVAVVVTLLIALIPGAGILAAIAIPAYQDYTTRSQITEGLNLAAPLKAEVAEYFERNKAWPGASSIPRAANGKYVSDITVEQGSIIITYGNAANPNIQGRRLALQPGIGSNGDVRWTCGYAQPVGMVNTGDGPIGADVAEKYLPSSCRSTANASLVH